MAGTKTIYNSTALECFTELLSREHGVVFDPNFVTAQIESLTATEVAVRLVAALEGPAGLPPRWREDYLYRFRKLDLSSIIPTDLAYSSAYPATTELLISELERTFDLRFDLTDLAYVTEDGTIDLTTGVTLSHQPNERGSITLRIRDSSQRFIGGVEFDLYITSPSVSDFQPLVLTGSAPDATTGDAYDFQYTVSGGLAPYTFEIIEGQAPTELDPSEGRLSGGYQATGELEWTVRVTDARGFTVDLDDSATIAIVPLTIVTPAQLPDGETASIYDQPIIAVGGTPPYSYTVLDDLPLGYEFTENAHLVGPADTGSHSVRIRVSDQENTQLQREFSWDIQPRSDRDVARAILAKVNIWFEFTQRSFEDGDALEATYYRPGNPSVLIVRGTGAGFGNDYIRLQGQYLEGQHNFSNEMSLTLGYRSESQQKGAGVAGRSTGQLGWQLYTDELDASRMRLALTLDSREYTLITSPSEPMNDGNYSLLTTQRFGELMFCHRNGQLVGQMEVAGLPIDSTTSVPMRVGTRVIGAVNGAWTADLYSMIFCDQRLWADELTYLYGSGEGRTYQETVATAEL